VLFHIDIACTENNSNELEQQQTDAIYTVGKLFSRLADAVVYTSRTTPPHNLGEMDLFILLKKEKLIQEIWLRSGQTLLSLQIDKDNEHI